MKKDKRKIFISYVLLAMLFSLGFLIFSHPTFAYTNKFVIQNSSGTEIFRIDDFGNMTNYGEGRYYLYSTSSPESPRFEIRNTNNALIFWIENDGDVHMSGTINQNANNGGYLSFPAGNNFIVQNSSGQVAAYIANNGDVYLKAYVVADIRGPSPPHPIASVFVTSNRYHGEFDADDGSPNDDNNGVPEADAICQVAAGANPYCKAWLSGTVTGWSVAERFPASMNIYQYASTNSVLSDGRRRLVSNGLPLSSITGSPPGDPPVHQYLINPIDSTQTGSVIDCTAPSPQCDVFTGTTETGRVVSLTCSGGFAGRNWCDVMGSNARTGALLYKDRRWTNNSAVTDPYYSDTCGWKNPPDLVSRLYCFCPPYTPQ